MGGTTLTPLGALARGVAAGAVGTLAMDVWLYGRYRRGGGTQRFGAWERSSGLTGWEDAPAPAQIGRRLVEGLLLRELAPRRAALTNNLTHWGYGMLGSAQYGLAAGSLRSRHALYGLPFGAALWAAGYVILPLAKLYEPIWRYDRRTLTEDLAAHLVYGLATAAAFERLSP